MYEKVERLMKEKGVEPSEPLNPLESLMCHKREFLKNGGTSVAHAYGIFH